TRYACDGLLHQRLDTPFIKYNGKFEKASWDEVYKIIKSKFENTSKEKICGFVGDLTNMETGYIFKEFFDRTLDIENYESRSDNRFIDTGKRENYLFNSLINGIEESDLIFLIGTNPRYEATILNARIRKSYLNNNTKIISLNDLGDLTYPYESLNGQTQLLKDIFDGNNEISKQIINANKPMIILGESLLNSNSSRYLFNMTKKFLTKNNKINDDWNAFNILSCDAATVGNFDLGIINEENNLLDDLKNHKFDIVYLVGQDNLNFDKKDEFIIYQGSHGDNGAEIADIILPGSAYTEQDGYYTNLEGIIQKAQKASYPPGEAKEDWQIINELAEFINNRKLFNDKDELESSMFNYLNLQKEKKNNSAKQNINFSEVEFNNEALKVFVKDYYFSNVIAKSSKTMIECHNSKINLKSTGTED
ncbi:MAG: molybdopterin-dependent oxidoreductase, partial [Pelagibacteraceae bacterium]|nr:molybdopterin-dependent oxidoreductase [Pelagibacteraceae bacterium]